VGERDFGPQSRFTANAYFKPGWNQYVLTAKQLIYDLRSVDATQTTWQ